VVLSLGIGRIFSLEFGNEVGVVIFANDPLSGGGVLI